MKFVVLLIAFLLSAGTAGAEDKTDFDYSNFSRLPIQHGGRVKPVDTYARAVLSDLSGRTVLGNMSADQVLAEIVFDPATAMERPVFRVFQPGLIGLPTRSEKYYSFAEIMPALQGKRDAIDSILPTKPEEWSEDQKQIMVLWQAASLYADLLRSFSFILPLNITPPAFLKIDPDARFTLQTFQRFKDPLRRRVEKIISTKGGNEENYTPEERDILRFAAAMQALETGGAGSAAFRVIPGAGEEWRSPWQTRESGKAGPYFDHWQRMADAYLGHSAAAWNEASGAAAKTAADFPQARYLALETFYNHGQFLLVATLLYFAALLALMGATLKPHRFWRVASFAALGVGGLANLAAILMRVLILSRPPVGTLYESIVFVAFICAAAGLAMAYLRKDATGLITGALGGLLLLCAAQGFAEPDSMSMLVAVLNTNFWLGTHVLCITMGYGWCVLAGLTAHISLVRQAAGGKASDLAAPLKTLILIALLFTSVGTALGGIWADQSWGRFWGWDPKENGALLIVLWLIWLIHGQLGGQLSRLWHTAAAALLLVVVALAWFGVNLLSVGLHSYGFISGIAAALFGFCAVEAIFIGGLIWRIKIEEAA